jgi:hypothetical protein
MQEDEDVGEQWIEQSLDPPDPKNTGSGASPRRGGRRLYLVDADMWFARRGLMIAIAVSLTGGFGQPGFDLDYVDATYPFLRDEDRDRLLLGLFRGNMDGFRPDRCLRFPR